MDSDLVVQLAVARVHHDGVVYATTRNAPPRFIERDGGGPARNGMRRHVPSLLETHTQRTMQKVAAPSPTEGRFELCPGCSRVDHLRPSDRASSTASTCSRESNSRGKNRGRQWRLVGTARIYVSRTMYREDAAQLPTAQTYGYGRRGLAKWRLAALHPRQVTSELTCMSFSRGNITHE